MIRLSCSPLKVIQNQCKMLRRVVCVCGRSLQAYSYCPCLLSAVERQCSLCTRSRNGAILFDRSSPTKSNTGKAYLRLWRLHFSFLITAATSARVLASPGSLSSHGKALLSEHEGTGFTLRWPHEASGQNGFSIPAGYFNGKDV